MNTHENIKLALIGLVMVALILYSGASLVQSVNSRIEEQRSSYEVHLGSSFVVDGDTLKILDYSMTDDTFTLSNGVKISSKLVKSND